MSLDYYLACLGEECGEVQQQVGKALRFGIDWESDEMTFFKLRQEMHDAVAAYELVCEAFGEKGDFTRWVIDKKKDKVKWTLGWTQEKHGRHLNGNN
jgi:hypothetical protein